MNKRQSLQDLDQVVTIKEFKIKPPVDNINGLTMDEKMGIKLHPLYASKFISIYGRTHSIKNLMSILRTTDEYFTYMATELRGKDLSNLINAPTTHRDNYWEIIELNMVDRLFKDKKLLNYLVNNYTRLFVELKPIVYNNAKRGIMNVEVTDKITPNYIKVIKNILTTVTDVIASDITNGLPKEIIALPKEVYVEIVTAVKLHIFNKIEAKVDGEIITGISNKHLRDAYLK